MPVAGPWVVKRIPAGANRDSALQDALNSGTTLRMYAIFRNSDDSVTIVGKDEARGSVPKAVAGEGNLSASEAGAGTAPDGNQSGDSGGQAADAGRTQGQVSHEGDAGGDNG